MVRLSLSTIAATIGVLLWATPSPAEKPQKWLEISSPHFTVISNSSEKQARRVAYQFEQIRFVFQRALPDVRTDPFAPIVVIVVKDEVSFRALTPESWHRKGHREWAGMFVASSEKNYALLRLDANTEDAYYIPFSQYAELLMNQTPARLPLWLEVGLAEFYGNSEIHEKEVWLGKPSEAALQLLKEQPLLPLATLFEADSSSSYYNKEEKGTVFSAECWALVHYFLLNGHNGNMRALTDYAALLSGQINPLEAASRVFGDLNKLRGELRNYVDRFSFKYLKIKGSTEVDEDAFTTHELLPAEADTARGDLLAHIAEYSRARGLLEQALQEDPGNAAACESLGIMALHQGNREEAQKWFERAVELDSRSYLAQYYYGVMSISQGSHLDNPGRVENSLQTAVRINPKFAPAYDALASFYGMRRDHLEEAHRLALQAVSLEPGNALYLVTTANILLAMRRADDAARVGERALSIAKSTEERARAQMVLDSAHQSQQYMAARAKAEEHARAEQKESLAHLVEHEREKKAESPPGSTTEAEPGTARWTAEGTILAVACTPSGEMRLTVALPTYKLELRAKHYRQVEFLQEGSRPAGSFNPCLEIKNRRARVVYGVGAQNSGELYSVDLTK